MNKLISACCLLACQTVVAAPFAEDLSALRLEHIRALSPAPVVVPSGSPVDEASLALEDLRAAKAEAAKALAAFDALAKGFDIEPDKNGKFTGKDAYQLFMARHAIMTGAKNVDLAIAGHPSAPAEAWKAAEQLEYAAQALYRFSLEAPAIPEARIENVKKLIRSAATLMTRASMRAGPEAANAPYYAAQTLYGLLGSYLYVKIDYAAGTSTLTLKGFDLGFNMVGPHSEIAYERLRAEFSFLPAPQQERVRYGASDADLPVQFDALRQACGRELSKALKVLPNNARLLDLQRRGSETVITYPDGHARKLLEP